MGHPGAGIQGEHLDARAVVLRERPQEDLPRLRMFEQVGGGFRDDQRQRAALGLGEPKPVGYLEGDAAGDGDVTHLGDGDRLRHHARGRRW